MSTSSAIATTTTATATVVGDEVNTCSRCHSVYEDHTPGTKRCTVCTRFRSIQSNAAHVRRDGHTPDLDMTLDQFATWFASTPRRCAYCTIDEDMLPLLGVLTQVGHPLQRLGLDRLDSASPYGTDNIALCCFACNKVKSNTFDAAEMELLGATVAAVWVTRLAAQGITWTPYQD